MSFFSFSCNIFAIVILFFEVKNIILYEILV